MDQRELENRVKQLSKAVGANEPPANAIALLESLKKDAHPTEEMLRVSLAPRHSLGLDASYLSLLALV